MQEAWLQLHCPNCSKDWEKTAADLPTPETAFDCDDCGAQRPLAEFMKTTRDLEILKEFQ